MDKVDVTGIDRDELLEALWRNGRPSSFYSINGISPPSSFELGKAKRNMKEGGYIHFACGRPIRSYVFTDQTKIDPLGYDLEYGEGAFRNVVDSLGRKPSKKSQRTK